MNTIASERSLNRVLQPPLTNERGKLNKQKITLDGVECYKSQFNNHIFYSTNVWTQKHFLMMDIITNELLNCFYRNEEIPKNPYKNEKLQNTENNLSSEKIDEIIKTGTTSQPKQLYLSDLNILRNYSFLLKKKLKSPFILQTLQDISQTKFLLNYPIRIFQQNGDNQGKFSFKNLDFIKLNQWTNLFDFEITKDDNPERGAIKLREYKLSFSTILGIFYCWNIYSLNIDYMNTELYNLSKYSQFIYRYVISHQSRKTIKVHLSDLLSILNLKGNVSIHRQSIKQALEELKANHFITSWDYDHYSSSIFSFFSIKQ